MSEVTYYITKVVKEEDNGSACCGCGCLIIILIIALYFYAGIKQNRQAEAARRMEIGRNYIGCEQSEFNGMVKALDTSDGQRFKIKLPQRDYYGMQAEQVAVIVVGNVQGQVDYQAVSFYDTNEKADMIFNRLDSVLTDNYNTSGQPSQAASGKTLVWKGDNLLFILQKNKADAPNRYLVTLTTKAAP